jgi:hypothetical protein
MDTSGFDEQRRRLLAAGGLALLGAPALAQPAPPSGREIVEKMEALLWANTMQGELDMRIVTPRWERTLTLRIWMDRPKRSFVRLLAPAKRRASVRCASATRCGR